MLESEGIALHRGSMIERVEAGRDGVGALIADGRRIEFDRLLVAAGRAPDTDELGLESVDVELTRALRSGWTVGCARPATGSGPPATSPRNST